MKQLMIADENGDSLETASHLKAKFEALKLLEEREAQEQTQPKTFKPKRFKVL